MKLYLCLPEQDLSPKPFEIVVALGLATLSDWVTGMVRKRPGELETGFADVSLPLQAKMNITIGM